MSKTVLFSSDNPIRFVKRDAIFPNQWGYLPFGKATFRDSIRPTQAWTDFRQPWERNDSTTVQIHRTEIAPAEGNWSALVILDCKGNELVTVTNVQYLTIPGLTTEDGEQLHSVQFKWAVSEYPELDGYNELIYQVSLGYGDDTREDYISAYVMDIAQKHEGTTWVRYRRTSNTKDTVYEQLLPSFGIRIPSLGKEYVPAGEYDTLEDQDSELTVLYSSAFNSFKWNIGGYRGIPQDWASTIDNITRCDSWSTDGEQVRREDNANLERLGQEQAALQHFTLMVRQAIHGDDYTFVKKEVLVWERPGTYPYAKHAHHMLNGPDTWGYVPPVAIYDEGQEDSHISYLNGLASSAGKTGEYQRVGDDIYYINGDGENYKSTGGSIFANRFKLVFSVTNAGFPISYRYTQLGNHLVDWGDNSSICELMDNNMPGLFTADHLYGAIGSKDVNLFTDNYLIKVLVQLQTNKVINIGGQCPANMQYLGLVEQNFSALTELDLAPIQNCRYTLQVLDLNTSRIQRVKTGWADDVVPASTIPDSYGLLKTIRLDGNNMDVDAVTDFTDEFFRSVAYTPFGLIRITQDPAAVIVDAGTLANITQLTDPISSGGDEWAFLKD